MTPGVMLPSEGLPKFREWQLVCVAVPGNPAPIAIGRAQMDSAKATERVSAAAKGRLVQSLQFYQDKLYEQAVAAGAPPTPNAGFRADIVLPLDWDPTQQVRTIFRCRRSRFSGRIRNDIDDTMRI